MMNVHRMLLFMPVKSLQLTLFSLFTFSVCLAQTGEEYVKKGMEAVKSKHFPEAIENFNQAIKVKSDMSLAYYGRGLAKYSTGDAKSAIVDYSKALTLKSDSVFSIYIARGKAKEAVPDYPEAMKDYDKAVELNPISQVPYYCRSRVNIALKDYHGAIREADQAISINPEFADAYLLRGFAKQNLNQKQSGCADFNKAQQLGSNQAAFAIRQFCN